MPGISTLHNGCAINMEMIHLSYVTKGWIKGRYNGKELSANANFRKLNKNKNN
jgi:hypothetical protein